MAVYHQMPVTYYEEAKLLSYFKIIIISSMQLHNICPTVRKIGYIGIDSYCLKMRFLTTSPQNMA